ncbi:MAG: YqaE/Pmp3 family membrane protein [Zunongwangia sp.]|jgi:uncharacterized membrane protein YqaE (UPF0057 family)|uniref:YqaE/Pmp3 family membrane protein n=1 Tax=Zunongwangia profunda TaxID=398743 RepID=A0A3D5IUT7_9FLAO|nr:YqaE/Pmp3 family membrane protein [Zunongwangia profunda]MAB91243.1 YqaE/Pmp3 family membrane protein [Planctomycetota bacterium]MAO34883.1 YqaE/Pmp3 family membrane protein [Zunongwangia sp.]MAS70050.1 YqaE/Pmp3 family membrane protein [Zunongwangia sp.]MCC4229004.1 YqaE/Pmp3 family membrane protein [Zunongwangia profunda]HCV79443.1 YqaE/Pmp3 family membrane protein [Zunongwangia profunda]|tara:strand:- start:540 stop:734 length:195 start_codon:yes stop_codon:yes gene_type:complete
MKLLTVILNVLLPPLSVYLKYGANKKFLINLILTLIGWVPGMIHAFIITDRYVKEIRDSENNVK